MMNSSIVLFFVSTLTFLSVVHCQNAPLLVWTSKDLSHCSPNIELKPELTLSSVFTEEYLQCLEVNPPQNIVAFVFEEFSSEQTLNKVYQSLSNIQASIQNYGFSIPSIKTTGVLEDLKLIAHTEFKCNFIEEYIEVLPESADQDVDAYVVDLLQKLNGSFLAVLSSSLTRQTSWDENKINVGRHLLQVGDQTKDATPTSPENTCIIGECVQLCYSSISYNQDSYSSPKSTFDIQEGSCEKIKDTYVPRYVSVVQTLIGNSTTSSSLKINMTFEQKRWEMSGEVFWALYGINANATELSKRTFYPDTYAPANWSFGCASPKIFTDSTQKNELQFKDLRVQAFIKGSKEFGRMFDCSGWFTGPIWVGLLVSLLLITMLSYAYGMISSITTMDKFDNPKGKTISVPQDS